MAGQNSNSVTTKTNHGKLIAYLKQRLEAIANSYDPTGIDHEAIAKITDLAELVFGDCDCEDDGSAECDQRGLPTAFGKPTWFAEPIFPKNPKCFSGRGFSS